VNGRLFAVALGSAFLIVAFSVGAQAAPATGDLIPDPSDTSWKVYEKGTGVVSVADLYGAHASSVKGFVDAYQKTWTQPGRVLYNDLQRYSSVLWSAFRLGESEGSAKANKAHTSYRAVAGFGSGAYEVTDPVDAQGYLSDTLVFTQGDYVAVIQVASATTPDHNLLMDQATGQLDLIPAPVAELNSIASGIGNAAELFGGFVALNLLVGGAIVAIVLTRRRRRRAASFSPASLNLSADRGFWWDGARWVDASQQSPPSAQRSPDGAFWWDGVVWRPVSSRPPG
jgi:hypothetical protein